jgi:hypothetical protein
MRLFELIAATALAMLLGACGEMPKQAFNRDAAKHVRTVIVTRNDNQPAYEAVLLAHPGASFGLIGGLVAAADMQMKSKRLSTAIDPLETRIQERFSDCLRDSLSRVGYTANVVVIPLSVKGDDVLPYAKKNATGDAVLIVNMSAAYWAAGPTSDYFPRLTVSVKLVDLLAGGTVYQDTLTYGYVQGQGKTVHFPSDQKYRFADMTALTDDPGLTREGLYRGMDAIANQIAEDLKRE